MGWVTYDSSRLILVGLGNLPGSSRSILVGLGNLTRLLHIILVGLGNLTSYLQIPTIVGFLFSTYVLDVDTLLQRGFFLWDCGMLGGAGMQKSHIFVCRNKKNPTFGWDSFHNSCHS